MRVEAAFQEAMANAGLLTQDPVIADGILHRIHLEGHKRGSRNGAYVLHGDGRAAGWFQDFVSGFKATWKADGDFKSDPDAHRRMKEARAKRDAEEIAKHRQAAARANSIWDAATEVDEHPYLIRKGVKAFGLRVSGKALLIPLRDSWGAIWSLQSILPDGTKKFMPGGKVKRMMNWVGNGTQTAFVAEGYATACTLAERTGFGAYVAFSSGNLLPVATELREIFPQRRIIIAGDADPVGRAKAEEAARASRAELSMPTFPPGVDGSDWNDLAVWEADNGDH